MTSATRHRRRPLPRPIRLLPVLALLLLALPAQAQLLGGGPQLRLPPVTPVVGQVAETTRELRGQAIDPAVRRLLRRHPDIVVLDPAGDAIVRGEVVAIDPRQEALDAARAAGFDLGSQRELDGLGLRVVVLHAPRGMDTAAALERLRSLDPAGSYDFNHLYFGSASTARGAAADKAPSPLPAPAPLRIGLIDSGVADAHPGLRATDVHAWGCNGTPVPGEHGTAIASLLSATTVYSADIYCGEPGGGSATAFAAAMAWLAREQVPVINVSLVGPDNLLLRRATGSMLAKGHVLVAAVGNDGPAAAPLFPAAYPGVIGVTAVDGRRRALPEALRGPQVDFAASGSGLRAAGLDGGWHTVRGTSFAAPRVAHAAASLLDRVDPADAAKVRDQLAAAAIDLGASGRDDTYGNGLLD